MKTSDRHFAYLDQLRVEKDPKKQKEICKRDIMLAESFNKQCMKEYGSIPKSYPSFKKLAIIYEKEGKYSEAIDVCKKAIAAGYSQDGTQGGMDARIRKLTEKEEKEKAK